MTVLPLPLRERLWSVGYRLTLAVLRPLSEVLVRLGRRTRPNSVLHISYMVHVAYDTTRILRQAGVSADYLAVGASPLWDQADYRMSESTIPMLQAWREFVFFWRVEATYEVVHSHFMMTMSHSGWEVPFLRRLGRALVVHYRGCEIRDRTVNMRKFPAASICDECDYQPRPCENPTILERRRLAGRYGDHFLVTTPDLLDFVPGAEHLPFFSPSDDVIHEIQRPPQREPGRAFRIVHVTTHPGIEGTRHIQGAVDRLAARGHSVELIVLNGVAHRAVLSALGAADLAIGKMKMGYYANAQIESMSQGVPTITCVRPEFMTETLRDSGFIFATLDTLEETLEYYITNPAALAEKRGQARAGVQRLHDNTVTAGRLVALYDSLRRRGAANNRGARYISSV